MPGVIGCGSKPLYPSSYPAYHSLYSSLYSSGLSYGFGEYHFGSTRYASPNPVLAPSFHHVYSDVFTSYGFLISVY